MLNALYHSIDPVIFSIGPIAVRWYGLAYLLGFIGAAVVLYRVAKRWHIEIDADSLLTIMICVVFGVLIGGRIGYCLMYNPAYYLAHPIEIAFVNQGGMSFHGGLIGALLSGIVAARMVNAPYLTLADLGAIGAPIGLFFGRVANFINGELWGAPTDLPWGVVFDGAAGLVARHPSQLYEAFLEGLVLFLVMFLLSRKRPPRPRGTFIGPFLVLYGIFRFAVEFVRLPDAHIGYLFGTDWFTMGQLLSLPLIVAGIAVFAYAYVKKLPQQGIRPVDMD